MTTKAMTFMTRCCSKISFLDIAIKKTKNGPLPYRDLTKAAALKFRARSLRKIEFLIGLLMVFASFLIGLASLDIITIVVSVLFSIIWVANYFDVFRA